MNERKITRLRLESTLLEDSEYEDIRTTGKGLTC